jgi:hypothetical protein
MRLEIDGWGVAPTAQADLDTWSDQELTDRCWLFRSPTAWMLVTMRRRVRSDDFDRPISGRATISSQEFSTLEDLAEALERTYTSGAWVDLLDAGYQHDDELYRAWGRERIRPDFDGASIHRKDLALYTGLYKGEAVPAPARELKGWQEDAVDQMAAHLVELGADAEPAKRHDFSRAQQR